MSDQLREIFDGLLAEVLALQGRVENLRRMLNELQLQIEPEPASGADLQEDL